MKPIRTTILAFLTAAIAIAPLASAEAHKRHRHRGDVAAAIGLGLLATGIIIQSSRHRHRHQVHRYNNRCYGLPYHAYHHCMNGYRYGGPVVVYPGHNGYYYDGLGSRHMYKNGR